MLFKADYQKKQSPGRASISGILLSLAVIILLAISGYLFFELKKARTFVYDFPLVDPSRNFIDQKDFIVNIQPLRDDLNDLVDEFGRESVSLYVEYLNTGANIAINPNMYLWPASLSKLPIAMIAMKKVENGTWDLNNELVLMQGDKNAESGIIGNMLAEYPYGTRFTIEKLLQELLVNSDNTALNMLVRNVHADETNELVEGLGLANLFDTEGKISAKEYSRMLRALYTASFLKRENSEKMLEWLDASVFDEFLASGISGGMPFPHKYGEDVVDNIYADSGIVYIPNRPYMITVITQGDPEKPFHEEKQRSVEFIHQVSKKTFDFFSKQ